MTCPDCAAAAITELRRRTTLGYPLFRCRACGRTFNARTGTPYNHLHVPTDIALLVVVWRLRYKQSLRDLAEMFLTRGFVFTHETVREWEGRLAPLVTAHLRAKRRGKAGRSWYCDETYIKVHSHWCYLYRCIDRDGNLVDTMLSETRDLAAATRFFAQAREAVGYRPERVTTDGHDAYPRAIRRALGRTIHHRRSRYLNNRLEQDHRGIKQRYYPMRGFGCFAAAARFCCAHDEFPDHLRYRRTMGEGVPLAEQRRMFCTRWTALLVELAVA
jgi:transposase-like protein